MKKVKDVMTEHVLRIHPGATLMEAAKRMQGADIGALPVCENGQLVGLITDRDIVVKAVAADADPEREIVANVMSLPVITCTPEQSAADAGKLMRQNKVRRVVIVDSDGAIAGIMSLGDLAKGARDDEFAARVLAEISAEISHESARDHRGEPAEPNEESAKKAA